MRGEDDQVAWAADVLRTWGGAPGLAAGIRLQDWAIAHPDAPEAEWPAWVARGVQAARELTR